MLFPCFLRADWQKQGGRKYEKRQPERSEKGRKEGRTEGRKQIEGCILGQSWLFGGSTSGYLQMKGRKYGAVESTGVVAGALEFTANERGMVGDWKAKSEREGEGRSSDKPRRATRNGGGSLFAYNSTIIAAELLSFFRRNSQNGLLSAKLPVCFLSKAKHGFPG